MFGENNGSVLVKKQLQFREFVLLSDHDVDPFFHQKETFKKIKAEKTNLGEMEKTVNNCGFLAVGLKG